MRKVFAAVLALLMLFVAACSSSGGSGDSGKVTITYALWDGTFLPGYKQALTQFKKSNPNIDVKFDVIPFKDYDTKLQAGVSSKTAPDVFWLQDTFLLYAEHGALADMAPMVQKSKTDLSIFPNAAVDPFKINGKLYGMPWTTVAVGLYYNKKLFDQAHLSYPTASWDWAKVQSAATKLTDRSKGIYGLAAPITGQEGYYNTIYQAGGGVISADHKKSLYDTPQAIQGLQFWTDVMKSGSSPTVAQLADTPASQLFGSGKLAMFYGGSWNAGTLAKSAVADDMDIAPLPHGATDTTDVTTAVNSISASSKHLDAAWKWVNFLASKSAQDIQASGGIVVPASTQSREAWVKSLPKYHMNVFMDEAKNGKPQPISVNTMAWRNQETTIFTPAWDGKESIQVAAKQMADAMNKDLADEAGN